MQMYNVCTFPALRTNSNGTNRRPALWFRRYHPTAVAALLITRIPLLSISSGSFRSTLDGCAYNQLKESLTYRVHCGVAKEHTFMNVYMRGEGIE